MHPGEQLWQFLAMSIELGILNTVCLDRFSIVHYQTLYVMPPLGISSIQETVSGCCPAECYLKNNILSTFINIPKIPCLALMVGSENKLVRMGTKFGRYTC